MDLSYSDFHENFRKEVQDFLAKNWPPGDFEGSREETENEFRQRATQAGYLYRHIPRKYGGGEQAADLVAAQVIRDEFRKANAPRELMNNGTTIVAPVLIQWGTEWQKEYFLPRIVTGEFLWCQGNSEPNAGSDLASMKTRAELVGDKWIINGQKIWCSRAYSATHMNLLCRTETAPRHLGLTYLLLDFKQPGIEVRRITQITGEAEFCEVFFNNAETPADWIIGKRGEGWAVSRSTFRHERAGFEGINWLDSILKRLVGLASETIRDGRPAIAEPQLRAQIARLQSRIMAMRYSTYRELSMEAAGQHSGDYLMMQKLYLTDTVDQLDRVSRDLIDDDFLLAQPGVGEDGRRGNVKWVYNSLHSLKMQIAGGSSNIQRNIIGERVLGLPKDAIGAGR